MVRLENCQKVTPTVVLLRTVYVDLFVLHKLSQLRKALGGINSLHVGGRKKVWMRRVKCSKENS